MSGKDQGFGGYGYIPLPALYTFSTLNSQVERKYIIWGTEYTTRDTEKSEDINGGERKLRG